MIRRLVLALCIGLVGAGLVHIAVIFLMPSSAPASSWKRLSTVGDPFLLERVDAILPEADPLFAVASCRFDLSRGPLRLTASGNVPFWSVALINSDGQTAWSMNERNGSGSSGDLDVMVVTALQSAEFRRETPPELASTVFARFDDDEGLVILRVFRPDPSFEPVVQNYFESVGCKTF